MLKPAPTPGETGWFVHDRFGMFIHWGLYTLPARHEWVKSRELIADEPYQPYFDHFDPEGHSPGYRMTQQGVSWTYNGENIAYGYDSAGDVMDGWMGSEGHRDNILHPIFTHIGIGVWLGPGGPFWVQDFYTP